MRGSISKGTARNIVLYSIANYLHTAINAVSNIFVSNILGPVNNGIISYYNAINTNVDQVVFSTFRASVERNVPQIQGDIQKREYAQQAYLLNFFSTVLFAFAFCVLGLFSKEQMMKISAFMMAGFSLFRCSADFYRVWNKSLNRIPLVSGIMIVSSLLIPVFAILFSYWFGLLGFWAGRIILQGIILICFLLISKEMFRLIRPDFKIMKNILLSGGEIVAFALFVSGIQTMDKYFVKGSMGLEQLGYYAIGSMVFTMLMLVPTSVTGAVYPRFVGKVNENLEKQVRSYSVYIEIICVLVAMVVYLFIPYLIKWFMPAYGPSVPIVRVLLLAFVSYSSVQLRYIDIIRKHRMRLLILYAAIAFVLGALSFVIIASKFAETVNFGIGTVISFLLLTIGVNLAWGKTYGYSFKQRLILALIAVVPILVLASFFCFSDRLALAGLIMVSLMLLIYPVRLRVIHF